ncbi:MAG: hypothetical protein HQL93_13175 [Magnetococcales bacterium]|nr:hypothetical protein [Magnetococcales bacterium]
MTKNNTIAGGAMVLAYDSQGAEKSRAVADAKTGIYTLDRLNQNESYTLKVFSSAKAKAGTWTTEAGYATGTATAASPAVTLNLILN